MSLSARRLFLLGAIVLTLLAPSRALAQARGRLIITVADPTGAVLPNATVTVTGLEDPTRAVTVAPAKADERGIATFENILQGRYSVSAEFPGFDLGKLPDVRVRGGDTRQTLRLALSRMMDSVTVGQDKEESASDRSMTFGSTLTREQLDALSDDPDLLRQQLMDLGGPDAVLSIDSFEGRQLPPKSQIRSVRISRDQFAAENHYAGGVRIEVISQPGVSPFRGSVGFNFYDSALDGKNPFVGAKGPAQNRGGSFSISGTLIREKLGYNLFAQGTNSFTTPVQYANGVARNATIRTPNSNGYYSGGIEYGLTRDHLLRVSGGWSAFNTRNQGVSTYDAIERAYASKNGSASIYIQEAGPVGRRFMMNVRASLYQSTSSTTSVLEAPTIVVVDQHTTGGAQRGGGSTSRSLSFNWDLDYVRGRHSMRVGIEFGGSHYKTDSATNYLGTYTFEDEAAFLAGRPRSYTRRIGDPHIEYWSVTTGLYFQDDIRIRKNLTVTPGVRYELQSLVDDAVNVAPRLGVTWAPFKSGRTTLRASWGLFYDWLPESTNEQTLRIDGFRQQEVNIANPSYPNPGALPAAPPSNKYLIDQNVKLFPTQRLSAGASQTVGRLSLNATYAYTHATGSLVGQNLNAPESGIRPDPAFVNVIKAVGGGEAIRHVLTSGVSLNLATAGVGVPGIPPPSGAKFLVWRRGLTVSFTHTLGKARNNSEGAFAVPATGSLDQEWGPENGDVRNRASLSLGSSAVRNLTLRGSINMNTAPPLTIRTGTDDNGDLIFNDRPFGVGRNTARTSGQWNSSASIGYAFTLGSKKVNTGGGVSFTSLPGGGLTANLTGAQEVPRYRLNVNVSITNLTNHANLTGYSGVMTSSSFLKPTNATGYRQIRFNLNVSF